MHVMYPPTHTHTHTYTPPTHTHTEKGLGDPDYKYMFVLVAETAEMGRLRFGCRDDSDRQSWVKWLVRATGQTDKPQNDTQDEQYDGEDREGEGGKGGEREGEGERG